MLDAKDYKVIDCGSEIRRMYEFNGRTPQGERVLCEIIECYPGKEGWGKNSLPVLWKKNGYTQEVLPNYLCTHTFAYQPDGTCMGLYDPQSMETWHGKRWVIDFDWMLTVSQENIEKLLTEVVRRANAGEEIHREPITERVLEEFKQDHNAFDWEWDEQKMRSRYTRHELTRHLLLACEVYYHKDEHTMGEMMERLHYVYPDVTEEQVQRVYDRYAEIVTAIYG